MSRINFLSFLFIIFMGGVTAFTVPHSSVLVRRRVDLYDTGVQDQDTEAPKVIERGVSVDQDGKSNVWAIEPKMELDTKSDSEKNMGLMIGGVSFAAFAVGAGFILTHLPDPNQF